MLRKKLYFDIKDTEYFNRLKQYILANYSTYFEIVEKPDIDHGTCTISDHINRRNKKGVFLVKEEKGDISKYCSANDICAALMKANDYGTNKKIISMKNELLIFCVSSASGGVGKSTISKALSISFALSGKKVLYINPNPFSAGEKIFTETEKNSYTRLRFYIRKKKGDISTILKGLASHDVERRVDFIVNGKPSSDGFINKDEAAWLISELRNGCPYEVIVFDVPSYPGEGHIELMKRANKNYLVYSALIDEKHRMYRRFLDTSGVNNISELVNFSKDTEESIPETKGIFNSHPVKFWNIIESLRKNAGENNEISN